MPSDACALNYGMAGSWKDGSSDVCDVFDVHGMRE